MSDCESIYVITVMDKLSNTFSNPRRHKVSKAPDPSKQKNTHMIKIYNGNTGHCFLNKPIFGYIHHAEPCLYKVLIIYSFLQERLAW